MGTVARPDNVGIAEWIFDCMKREVIQGRVAAGEILVEGAVAERFDVSRGPAREALHRLAQTGLVTAIPRVGYQVTQVTGRDFEEVFSLRLLLEPEATRLATKRITAGECPIDRLRALGEGVHEINDVDEDLFATHIFEINWEFHHHIAQLSNNLRLEQAINTLLDFSSRVLHLLAYKREMLEPIYDDHPLLVRTMATGDADGAAALMAEQLDQTRTQMRSLVSGAALSLAP